MDRWCGHFICLNERYRNSAQRVCGAGVFIQFAHKLIYKALNKGDRSGLNFVVARSNYALDFLYLGTFTNKRRGAVSIILSFLRV